MEQTHIQACMQYINSLDNEFETLRDEYVPGIGMADTVGGEIIRAMDRLVYRWYNDGDRPYNGYGNETCNSSFRYLLSKLRDENGRPNCPNLGGLDEEEYWDGIADLMQTVKDFLDNNPDLFERKNYEDSRSASEEDRRWAEEDEEDEDYDY